MSEAEKINAAGHRDERSRFEGVKITEDHFRAFPLEAGRAASIFASSAGGRNSPNLLPERIHR